MMSLGLFLLKKKEVVYLGVEQIFKPFEQALWQVLATFRDFAINFAFGILALLFGIRLVSGLLRGNVNIVAAVLTVIFGFLAVSMGQTFWTSLPIYQTLFH